MITKNPLNKESKNKNLSGQALWYYQTRYYLPKENGKYLVSCDFCLRNKIKINKNFHILNRNKAKFWTKDLTLQEKLICSCCLFEGRELEIDVQKKEIFKQYKFRYLKSSAKTHE